MLRVPIEPETCGESIAATPAQLQVAQGRSSHAALGVELPRLRSVAEEFMTPTAPSSS